MLQRRLLECSHEHLSQNRRLQLCAVPKFPAGDVGMISNSGDCTELEVKLHRELDEAWITGTLWEPELRRAELQRLWLFTNLANRLEQWVYVVPDVEELGAKFEMHFLADREHLEDGEVPIL